MSLLLRFQIILYSDYHIGAGHGLGLSVDSALLRDSDDVPVIRGTTLTGLLRDSLRKLLRLEPFRAESRCKESGRSDGASYCGQWYSSDVPCPICSIFGSPHHVKNWRISSARPVELEQPQREISASISGKYNSQINTHVRIDPRSRRAEENKLYSREVGDGRLRFSFTAECPIENGQAWREAEWLVAAARLTRNLGASRHRGLGECEFILVGVEPHLSDPQKTILDRFAARSISKRTDVVELVAPGMEPIALPAGSSEHAYCVRALVRLDEPLLLARRAEAGNLFETVTTIPGSAILGAFAWNIAYRVGSDLKKAGQEIYQSFISLFFQDAVRFSCLTPVCVSPKDPYQGYVTIMAPRDLVTCELYPGFENEGTIGHGVWSKIHETLDENCPECSNRSPELAYRAALNEVRDFVVLSEGGLRSRFSPRKSVEMHIRVNPETGRVAEGDLYGYVVLEPGQFFVGQISCRDEAIWKTLCLMAGMVETNGVYHLRLGKASRRGHGQVSIVFEKCTSSPWHGSAIQDRVTNLDQVVMTLLSDTIIVDDWGRFAQSFSVDWLRRELNLPEKASVEIVRNRSFAAVRSVQSFKAHLGLPRPRDLGMVAGSTVQLRFSGMDKTELQTLLGAVEANGIGLRRNEGFGVVAFNHPVYRQEWTQSSLDIPESMVVVNAKEEHFLFRLEQFRHTWAQHLDRAKSGLLAQAVLAPVARLVHASSPSSGDAVDERLIEFGNTAELIDEQLQGREKPSLYHKGDAKHGMQLIYALLGELKDEIERQDLPKEFEWQLWRIGLQLLADRIASSAHRSGQG